MDIKHIYWFAYFDSSEPSVRYRALYPLQYLQDNNNITFSLVYPGYTLSAILYFLKVYLEILVFRKKDSLVVYQNIRTNHLYANALKLLLHVRPSNTIYDIDDADYLRYPPGTINFFIKNCKYCSVGSEALFVYAKRFNPECNILTSPIRFTTKKQRPDQKKKHSRVDRLL